MSEAVHAHLLDSIAGYLRAVSESLFAIAARESADPDSEQPEESRPDRLAAV